MSPFHLSVADNLGAVCKWHHKAHQGPWAECIWEPCNKTESDFRRMWDR